MTVPDLASGDVISEAFVQAVADKLNGIQFGTKTANTDANGRVNVDYVGEGLSAYSSAPYVFVMCVNTSGYYASVRASGTGSFNAEFYDGGGTSRASQSVTFVWVALGTLA